MHLILLESIIVSHSVTHGSLIFISISEYIFLKSCKTQSFLKIINRWIKW